MHQFPTSLIRPVPAISFASEPNAHENLLLWVPRGSADVRAAGHTYRLAAGDGAWIPEGVGYRLTTSPGTVVCPVFPPAGSSRSVADRVTQVSVPADWGTWMIYQFARSLGYMTSPATDTGLLEMVSAASPRTGAPHAPSPAPPRSAVAMAVARRMLIDLVDDATVSELAREANVSARTLHQRFVDETGLPPARWRTAARIATAAGLIDRGTAIGAAGHQVGFATAAGFTRSFTAHTGITPREYVRTRVPEPTIVDHVRAAFTARSAPLVPAATTWERVNDFHLAAWMYCGTAEVTVGGEAFELRRGDAIVLPAGVPNHISIDADSLLLPLGSEPANASRSTTTTLMHFPDEADDFLLHTMVANYSTVRPRLHDPGGILRLVRSVAAEQVAASPAPAAVVVAALRTDPGDQRDLHEWAADLGIPVSTLRRQFIAEAGEPFGPWRTQLRMTAARRLLEDRLTVSEVGARVGYAHQPAFTRAFVRAHGFSPRDFRDRSTHRTGDRVLRR